ncbi:unnamed protein product [Vitrella brassicaformis CCMP3155]|uniref:Uncharacterized protein n=1 Tax=Vitrella brassicaformis (strain CCMP3155) TaxID=1169540 RepID=A0A0G4GBU0_VITBC|nr:unnamed protein product [Vitrella brassicaformis CCMP3155]|eukprot:CEM26568.1 unnamed protein product [Vitrella brassicaformis CCMP3155]
MASYPIPPIWHSGQKPRTQAAILCFGLVHQGPHAGKSLVFIMPKTSALPTGESTRVHGWWAVQAADSSSRDRRSYEIVEWREVADTVTRRAGFEDTAVWEYADSEFSSFLSMCGGEQQFWREHEAGRRPSGQPDVAGGQPCTVAILR